MSETFERKATVMAAEFRRRIQVGMWAPGLEISENVDEIGRSWGYSPPVVAGALNRLMDEGLLERSAGGRGWLVPVPGAAAGEAERAELQALVDGWVEQGVFRSGEVIWDPKEGRHWVEVGLATGHSRGWTPEQFRGYVQGLSDALRYYGSSVRRGQG